VWLGLLLLPLLLPAGMATGVGGAWSWPWHVLRPEPPRPELERSRHRQPCTAGTCMCVRAMRQSDGDTVPLVNRCHRCILEPMHMFAYADWDARSRAEGVETYNEQLYAATGPGRTHCQAACHSINIQGLLPPATPTPATTRACCCQHDLFTMRLSKCGDQDLNPPPSLTLPHLLTKGSSSCTNLARTLPLTGPHSRAFTQFQAGFHQTRSGRLISCLKSVMT